MVSCRLFLIALAVALISSGSPTLAHDIRDSVRTALASNPKIRARDAAVRAAAFDLLETRGSYMPTVSIFGTIGPEYVDDPGGLTPSDNAHTKNAREIGIMARLPVFDGLRRANTVYARAARLDREMFAFLDASETMSLTVAQAHIDVARLEALMRIARDHLNRHLEISRQVEEQVTGGRLPLSDQLQAETRVEAVRITISDLERDLDLARARYLELVGIPPRAPLTTPAIPALPRSRDAMIRTAVRNNFRIRSAQANVDARKFERNIAEADYLPQVSVNTGASVGRDLDGSSGDESRVFVGVTLDWQIFSGGRTERRLSLIERQNEALYDRMAIIREVERLADEAWSRHQSYRRVADLAARQVATNRELVDQYLVEFNAATRSLLDVLIAETELFHARLTQLNAQAGALFSAYRILAAESRLAEHFGIDRTGELLALEVRATETQKPFSVIDKARPVVDK